MRSTRGVIPVAVLWVIGLLGASQLVPNWRISHLFAKGPPTIELSKAEAALATAKADAAKAQTELLAAQAKERAQTVEQVRYSQQMIAGVPAALKRAPVSPEVSLASQLAERASKGLSAAIGDLPADKQAEITAIVEDALSAKQAEVDQAKAALAAKDAELTATTAAKAQVEAQIPVLTAKAATATEKADAAQTVVAAKTAEVVAYADKAAAELHENGTLRATIWYWGIRLAIAYAVIFWVVPSLAQEFPALKPLVWLNQTLKSITTAHL